MKMARIEKVLVNGARHSRRVAEAAEGQLRELPVAAGQTYLDVGCGNGAAAIRVAAVLGLDVTGVDVDPDQIRQARATAKGTGRFVAGDATRLPFDDGVFDLVATRMTTHHIPDWPRVVSEMVRVLKPGGHLFYADFVVPEWLASPARRAAGKRAGVVTRRDLEHLLAHHALEVVRRRSNVLREELVCRKPCAPPEPPSYQRAEVSRPVGV